ncbi:MAG: hypothetical protein ACLGIF_04005 [Actinomycetes bacterium]
MNAATLAGTVSTTLFALSTLPMLLRAARTRDLASYSRGQLVLSNLGNLVHTLYVASLPAGPVWFLHAFYLLSTALMLFWHLRHVPADPRPGRPQNPAFSQAVRVPADHHLVFVGGQNVLDADGRLAGGVGAQVRGGGAQP